ncbi:DUF4190 domain-containing protein [Streptomyces sp. MUM 203J]|uniref:DUF4190 domain-containing protein n=1 Tax=Streptomyces sp. MUM 203J TaxID=2791990 RepID=UPI001F0392ED|nr:DUF4190 domain-containing protein [Streptomyces sp. MUM 203J]MCH0539077.1 DUF4190 domain-containing protein [Streptomyces sp. MUM 203J]
MTMPTQNGPHQPGGWPPPPQTPQSPYGSPGMPGFPGMPYPPPPPPRNGLGVTGMVLGIVGIVFATVPITFWFGGVLGLLALVFGIVGQVRAKRGEATNRGMAITGIILGALSMVAALVWLTLVVLVIVEARDKGPIDHHGPSDSAPAVPGEDEGGADGNENTLPGSPEPLPFGTSFAYEDGLKVTIGEPERYPADSPDVDVAAGETAFRVKLTYVNEGPQGVDIGSSLPMVTDADGDPAEMVFNLKDTHLTLWSQEGLGAGETISGTFSFSAPSDALSEVELTLSPSIGSYEDTVWRGPVS